MKCKPDGATPLCFVMLSFMAFAGGPAPVSAQEASDDDGSALRLMVGDAGLGIGHVPRVTGLRINWSDRQLERVRGVDLTLWRPNDPIDGQVQGLALGSIPQAGTIQGLAAGIGVVGEERLMGLQLGALAIVSGSSLDGVSVGGLAAVGGERMEGIHIGGLGAVAGCEIRGLQASAGIVEVRRDLLNSGLPSRDEATPRDCAAPEIVGVTVAGYRVRGASVRGITTALAWLDAEEVRGVSIGGFQRSGLQVGLAVGLVNWTDTLHGVQLGLLNRAGNNPPPFRILPLINLNLSD